MGCYKILNDISGRLIPNERVGRNQHAIDDEEDIIMGQVGSQNDFIIPMRISWLFYDLVITMNHIPTNQI